MKIIRAVILLAGATIASIGVASAKPDNRTIDPRAYVGPSVPCYATSGSMNEPVQSTCTTINPPGWHPAYIASKRR